MRLLVLLILALPVHADVVETRLAEWSKAPTIPQTLEIARERVLQDSIRTKREHVGGIIRRDGQYILTHGTGRRDQSTVTWSVKPHGGKIVALWHTHGPMLSTDRDEFSRNDENLVRDVGLPLYLITPLGEVKVLRPR